MPATGTNRRCRPPMLKIACAARYRTSRCLNRRSIGRVVRPGSKGAKPGSVPQTYRRAAAGRYLGAEPIQKQDSWAGYLPPEQNPHCVARGIRHIKIERRKIERRSLAHPANLRRHIPIQIASIDTVDLRREEQGPDAKSTPRNDRSTSIKTSRQGRYTVTECGPLGMLGQQPYRLTVLVVFLRFSGRAERLPCPPT